VLRGIVLIPLCVLATGCAVESSDPQLGGYSSWEQYARVHGQGQAPAGDFELPAEATLRDCLTYAALNNPSLKASFHRWQASVERIAQVKALPDPKFTYAYYIREVETRVGPQRQAFTLSQAFPWFEKLQLKGAAAEEEARAHWFLFQDEKLELYARVTAAWCDYYYLGRAVAVTRDNLSLLEQIERLVRTRYRAAAAGHPDLIRLQVELGKLADHLESLKDIRRPTLARLNAALGRTNTEEMLSFPAAPAHEPVTADRAQLLHWMSRSNTRLLAMDHQTAAAERRVRLAKTEYIPDVTLSGTFVDTGDRTGPMKPSDSGQDAVIASVTVNIPIWFQKLSAGVREAWNRRRAASMARAQKANDLAADLQEALFRVDDAGRKIRLYSGTLLPKARESLKVTQTGFIAGTNTFTDLIDAQRILLEFELSHQRALADHARWRAQLERIVGRPLDVGGNPATRSVVDTSD